MIINTLNFLLLLKKRSSQLSSLNLHNGCAKLFMHLFEDVCFIISKKRKCWLELGIWFIKVLSSKIKHTVFFTLLLI